MNNSLILASSSTYRKALLTRLNIPFDVIYENIDESANNDEAVDVLVKRLALEKAAAIAKQYPSRWVLASDQLAHFDGFLLGKPGDHSTAFTQLKMCSGKECQFLTGVALVNLDANQQLYIQSQVDVKFLGLTDQQINSYLLKDKPYDCAGSFKIEALGIALFEWVKSDDPTSLEGLPLISLCRLLRQAGFDFL